VDGLKSPEAKVFAAQTQALSEFMEMADGVLSKVARSEQSTGRSLGAEVPHLTFFLPSSFIFY
jgi:hypothetical protein